MYPWFYKTTPFYLLKGKKQEFVELGKRDRNEKKWGLERCIYNKIRHSGHQSLFFHFLYLLFNSPKKLRPYFSNIQTR